VKRKLLIAGLAVLMAAVAVRVGVFLVRVLPSLHRVDAGISHSAAAGEPINILVTGSDSRAAVSEEQSDTFGKGKVSGTRADSILLVHYSSARHAAVLVSLPRDLRVAIPGTWPGRPKTEVYGKLDSAFNGGPALLVKTVERFTGLPIDHFVSIDLAGFQKVIDTAGGLTVDAPCALKDKVAGLDLKAGTQRVNGSQALALVRARHFDPQGDFGRQARQRALLIALFERLKKVPTTRWDRLVSDLRPAVAVDKDLSSRKILGMARSAKGMKSKDVQTLSLPSKTGMIGRISYVLEIPERTKLLWEAIAADQPVPQEVISGAPGAVPTPTARPTVSPSPSPSGSPSAVASASPAPTFGPNTAMVPCGREMKPLTIRP